MVYEKGDAQCDRSCLRAALYRRVVSDPVGRPFSPLGHRRMFWGGLFTLFGFGMVGFPVCRALMGLHQRNRLAFCRIALSFQEQPSAKNCILPFCLFPTTFIWEPWCPLFWEFFPFLLQEILLLSFPWLFCFFGPRFSDCAFTDLSNISMTGDPRHFWWASAWCRFL